ncbi:CU044_5270 family protein [Streptomyces seoulensis]|uniref:CU044_5270 family protein n=1 Tax=Streptomyces seoulensis TaxID=73044 RepID=UPI003C2D8AD4
MSGKRNIVSPEPADDRHEIARLLPAPADRDLTREQFLHHKDILMRHIDRDRATARPARRLLRPMLVAPVTALALAGLVTAGVTLTDEGHQPALGASSGTAGDMQPASALLHRISDAAGKRAAPSVRDDQFSYVKEKVREADLSGGKAVVGPLHDYELWLAQDPGPLRTQGLIRSDGETARLNAELGDTNGTPAGFSRPTYVWLSSLPTDPDDLLDYLYAKTPRIKGRERDQAVFEQIGDLLDRVMPSRTAAALYRAAAKIPGVTEAPHARDAIGRQGLGIARTDRKYGIVTEWVFDKEDYTYLGHRTRLTKDTSYAKSGTLLDSSALLRSAIVDEAGRLPGGSKG